MIKDHMQKQQRISLSTLCPLLYDVAHGKYFFDAVYGRYFFLTAFI